jgi:hypothetical protein
MKLRQHTIRGQCHNIQLGKGDNLQSGDSRQSGKQLMPNSGDHSLEVRSFMKPTLLSFPPHGCCNCFEFIVHVHDSARIKYKLMGVMIYF